MSEGEKVRRLVQVTWEMSDPETRKREFAGLLEAAKATGCDDLTIVTREEEGEEAHEGRKVKIVPVCRFLLAGNRSNWRG